jgi:hypothetical protein
MGLLGIHVHGGDQTSLKAGAELEPKRLQLWKFRHV